MGNTIVNGCVYAQKLEDACLFLRIAFKSGVKLNTEIYNNIFKNLLTNKVMDRSRRMDYCAKFCQELNNKGIELDTELYSQIMKNLYIDNIKAEKVRAFHGIQAQKEINNQLKPWRNQTGETRHFENEQAYSLFQMKKPKNVRRNV